MEQRFSLPVRASSSRRTTLRPSDTQVPFAIVSPQRWSEFQAQQHQELEAHELNQVQYQPSLHYAQYQGQMAPTLLQYNQPGTAAFTFIQPYTLMPPPAAPITPKRAERPPLPLPSHILPSQKAVSQPCLACGKSECALASHKHFSKHVLASAKKGKQPKALDLKPPQRSTTMPATPGSRSSTVSFSYSVSLDPEREHLLGLWSQEWSPIKRGPERHLFPRKFIDKILPAARNHTPLLQALLAYSGTVWSIANHVPAVSASGQHAMAVELLSQACPTELEASTDEAMLAATLLLLIYMAQGNAFEVNKHVSGLVHLAGLRGGPYYLGLSGLVAELLIYADHSQAIFFNHEPVWQFPLPPLNMGLPPKSGKSFQDAMDAHELERLVAQAALSVCKVADIFDCAAGDKGLLKLALNTFGYLSMIAEYQLARCNALHHRSASVNECICLALILFNHVVLRNDGATTQCIIQVEYRFWQALELAEGRGLRSNILSTLYMWMVITGLTMSIRGECKFRGMGVEKLRAAKINTAIRTWDQFRQSVLEEYVWLQSAQEETFRAIWLEMEGLKSDSGVRTPQSIGDKGR